MAQQTYGEWMRSNPPLPNMTAVDYLIKKFQEFGGSTILGVLEMRGYIDQAKQIEKEQIIDTYHKAQVDISSTIQFTLKTINVYVAIEADKENAEEYYNQTFKNQ